MFIQETDDPTIVFPNGVYANAEEFYNGNDLKGLGNWQQAEIPFMQGFQIMAVDDWDADGNENVCYRSAMYLTNVLPIVLAATALNFLA